MMEKRAKWEEEIKQRGLDFLKADQTQRAEQKRKAEEARLDRAKKKSKRLAKQHKQGVKQYKPAPKDLPRPKAVNQDEEGMAS
jgi:hypothetical protein